MAKQKEDREATIALFKSFQGGTEGIKKSEEAAKKNITRPIEIY